MKNKLYYGTILFLLLSACNQNKKVHTEKDGRDISLLQIEDKGLDTIFLDKTEDFENLALLQLTKYDDGEYLSHFNRITRSINIYSLESGKLINKVVLASEGPNQIIFPITPTYFIHSLDSIFIDSYFNTYYLVNNRAEILNTIGKRSESYTNSELSVSFGEFSFFDGTNIHGNIRVAFYGTPKETDYARANFKLQEELEISKSVKSEDFIDGFQEALTYRKNEEKGGEELINLPRYFVHYADNLYATTPVSDSIRVFENGKLVESFYAGIPDFDKVTHTEYLNFLRVVRKPGEMRAKNEMKRSAYYFETFIDPDGQFIYRVLAHGTHAVFNEAGDREIGFELNGATLLAIDIDTKKITTLELPVKEILVERQVFAGKKGVYFKVKNQQNEDQALYRIFGVKGQK
ncbi:DUF4221 family protein [Roseivirga echinicomitans]